MNLHKYYKNKTILVTGGAGAIGGNLVKALSETNPKLIIILDDLSSSYKWNVPSTGKVIFVKGDVTNDVDLRRVFNEKPQIVFHLAAFFANQNSVDYPIKDLDTNGYGTLKLLEYSSLAKIEKFVYASSGCSIYGSHAPLPLKEDFMSTNLSTPYQITKMLGELYCNFYFNHYALPVVKTRFFNSYGPGEVPGQYRNVIPNFIYWALKGMPLPITGTGDETRDFTYVGDLVDGILRAGSIKEAVGQEFNLASGRETKIKDLANMIKKITQSNSEIIIASKRKWDTKNRILASVNKANKIIGYKPKTKIKDGLIKTAEWFKENWEDIENSAQFNPGISSAVREAVKKRA